MLRSLRQGGVTKGLMGAVVILIIAAFALDYRTTGISAGDNCVVEVDSTCVEVEDYHALLRLVAPPGATNKQLREAGFVKYAVDALVERELLLREARRLGVAVSEEKLDEVLATGQVHFSWPADAPIPQALAAGRQYPKTGALPTVTYIRVRNTETNAFDYNIYKRQVQNRLRMSPKKFKNAQEDEVIAARVRELITTPVRVSEDEVFSQYQREKNNATARIVEAKLEWFERFAAHPSEAEVDAFLSEKQAAAEEAWEAERGRWTGACPVVSEIFVSYAPGADDEAKAATRSRADAAAKALADGTPFAVSAKIYSESPTAAAGGALGCLTADYGPSGEDLKNAVEKLAPGKISDVLESPRGLHVFQFHGTLTKEEAETRGRRAAARRALSESLARERAEAFANKLLEAGRAGGDLEQLAKEHSKRALQLPLQGEQLEAATALAMDSEHVPQMEVSRTFTRAGSPIFGVKGDVDVSEAVFSLEKADDFVAQPIETHTSFAVIQLKEKTEVTREEFDEEKVELLRAARELRRAEVLSSYVERLRQRVEQIKINPKHTGEAADGEDPESPMESSG